MLRSKTEFDIDKSKVKEILSQSDENLIILDVRSEAEFISKHHQKALNIPIGSPAWNEFLETFDHDKTYVVYCASGIRSAMAVKAMAQEGAKNLYNVKGGLSAMFD
jgi:rhodanese-related sulfurtransferase